MIARARLLAAAALVALVAGRAPAAAAQDSATGPDPLAGLNAASLRPGSWTYAATVERGGESVELARRTLSVRTVQHAGAPAWLILDETRARGQTMTDSLVVGRDDLRPLRRAADMGPMRIALDFGGDSVTGSMSVPGGGSVPVALDLRDRRLLVNSGMLEAALTLLPLRAGWTGTVAQLAPSPLGASVVAVTLAVTGEDTVTVPAGQFAAWVLTASAAGAEQRLWVAKETGRLVQQEAVPPHSTDVVYRTTLIAADTTGS